MAAIALIALQPPTRVLGPYPFLAATLWSGYVAFIGGDIFPAYRHLIPLIVIAAFAFAERLHTLTTGVRRHWRLALVASVTLVVALTLPGYARRQFADKQSQRRLPSAGSGTDAPSDRC